MDPLDAQKHGADTLDTVAQRMFEAFMGTTREWGADDWRRGKLSEREMRGWLAAAAVARPDLV